MLISGATIECGLATTTLQIQTGKNNFKYYIIIIITTATTIVVVIIIIIISCLPVVRLATVKFTRNSTAFFIRCFFIPRENKTLNLSIAVLPSGPVILY
jgi:hypothetical protein